MKPLPATIVEEAVRGPVSTKLPIIVEEAWATYPLINVETPETSIVEEPVITPVA